VRRSSKRPTFRPRIETLEDRTVPSTVTWINPSGGDWNTPANWSTGATPTATDDVVIDVGPNTLTVSHTSSAIDEVHSLRSEVALLVSAGSLSLQSPSLIDNTLTVTGGTFGGTGAVNVNGLLSLSGATLAGPGGGSLTASGGLAAGGLTLSGYRLTIPAGQTGVMDASNNLSNGSSLDNRGILQLGAGSTGASITGDATAVLTNEGTLRTINTALNLPIVSTGDIIAASGALILISGSGISTFAGRIDTTAADFLDFGGNVTLTAISSVTASAVGWAGCVAQDAGSFNATGNVLNQATVTMTGAVTGLGGTPSNLNFLGSVGQDPSGPGGLVIGWRSALDLTGATLAAGSTNLVALTLVNGGVLQAAAGWAVSGPISVDGGRVDAGGGVGSLTASGGLAAGGLTLSGYRLTIPAGQTGVMDASNTLSNGSFLDNRGTLQLGAGSTGASINGDATAVLTNEGTLRTINTVVLGVAVKNSGCMDVRSGNLICNSSYVQAAGATVLDGGSISTTTTLAIQGGSLSGAGTIQGDINNAGQVSPGFSPGTITIVGDYTQTDSGAYAVEIGGLTPGNQYDQLAVSGHVVLSGALSVALVNGFVPHVGDTFAILHDTSGTAVSGTFAGLADGTIINSRFRINYVSGDVILTFVLPPPSSLSGVVFKDFNEDGFQDYGELGAAGVNVQLTGTDFNGTAVSQSYTTAASGYFQFANLLPGSYTVSVPSSLTITKMAVGLNGSDPTVVGNGHSAAGLAVVEGTTLNFVNFGVEPAAGDSLHRGETAGVGFWNNKNGQALIKSLNGGTGAQLGNWLAATFTNMFGTAGHDLTGSTDATVAGYFQTLFATKGDKLEAQVLATALSVYVTNSTLAGGTYAASYGFTVVAGGGTGLATFNVGSGAAAVGQATGTTMTIMDILLAVDQHATQTTTGTGFVLYSGDQTSRSLADDLFGRINDLGAI
jgi:hypothetical protein